MIIKVWWLRWYNKYFLKSSKMNLILYGFLFKVQLKIDYLLNEMG